ncbi:variant erythrocyte surface antigen-1 alpha subunit [Babesia bovis T2Bo]|uniref:Variant erythrocyte surface antigen-1, alpha subunit n=1 Tax=Babesia bovis TaxID=5865 RepID=A7AML5_BABBO|nr:variant erythrocyte surface antigen-1 alpha subunit [Babesia bovis T2Bo]EDO07799.1 variant erythrocyte surface antigen-1 alpha subunit [Babesia bovis T2Bo]|eukprot:XP_001611367.1 variant erythrocyte surface antigen-1, alpha subunit [Babesia bovis T2Bo]
MRAQSYRTHPCTECICGLAAAVTDLLQSVQLEYHGEGNNGPPKKRVTECLNELFSLVQGLGGTSVVRTYIDQLAQVLSALVGWSKIDKCGNCDSSKGNQHGTNEKCQYLQEVKENKPCDTCKCMKWVVPEAGKDEAHYLGRRCTRCEGSGQPPCKCSSSSGSACQGPDSCKCALAGKCCKCCCTSCGKCSDKCSCIEQEKNILGIYEHNESYVSAYKVKLVHEGYFGREYQVWPKWSDRKTSKKRAVAARNLLGSVCLIWSGLTYMYWTGKYAKGSPRWNNHILDGSGLDDGTLSQWIQALGFPRDMLNNSGPQNRLDKVIWNGIMGKLYLGFPNTGTGGNVDIHGYDGDENTFRDPSSMNYAGYIHTMDKGAFCSNATIFHKNDTTSTTDENTNKCGALYKLYILSCAYFTGLQKKTPPKGGNTNPKTIREILYWLSALPYSPAYPMILEHSKEVLKKVAPDVKGTKTLSFYQTGRTAPITVHEYNLFAHFQAVTQYCPLVLIGIQGGIHSPKGTDSTTEPAIHSLYANTECSFTYPAVDIQAYNQVVHYIRALFYQLYFLRKQCAVKVALGGKWRECRYGSGVIGKDVVSWMCLGCDPMEHDRNYRVKELKKTLDGVTNGTGENDTLMKSLASVLEKIGEVVVQLGNAQERLDRGKYDLGGVMDALNKVFPKVYTNGNGFKDVLQGVLGKLETEKMKGLEDSGLEGVTKLKEAVTKAKGTLTAAKEAVEKQHGTDVDPCKNLVSAAIDGIHKVLDIFKKWAEQDGKDIIEQAKKTLEYVGILTNAGNEIDLRNVKLEAHYSALLSAINQLISICSTSKCPPCHEHAKKCGKQPQSKYCDKCHQQYMDGTPSPLQAFLEDRLPGFSCSAVVDQDENPEYPLAASHLGHCGGSGQCCPLPMGFRNNFQKGSTGDMTGARLYGILYFFSNENMMQSCVYTLVRVTAALSATTPQVLGDVFGFFRGGVGNPVDGKNRKEQDKACKHEGDPSDTSEENKEKYFCGWCASGLRDVVNDIEWIPRDDKDKGGKYRGSVGEALIDIKGDKGSSTTTYSSTQDTNTSLSRLTKNCQYLSPLTGELYTAVSATFGGTYLSWVLYLSDALHSGLESLSEAFRNIECRGCKGNCDPNKCTKGEHGSNGGGQCGCQSIVSCTGVLPVLYRHGFSYGNPFNLEGYQQGDGKVDGQYDIKKEDKYIKQCHQFLDSLNQVIKTESTTPLHALLSAVGKLQYDIRLPWIFVLTVAWLVAVLYLAFGAIWPLDWTHMRSHWLRGGAHQWQCMWYKVMTGRKGMELVEYFDQRLLLHLVMV